MEVPPPRTTGAADAAAAAPSEAALPESAEPVASVPPVASLVDHGERVEHEAEGDGNAEGGVKAVVPGEAPVPSGPVDVVCPEASAAKAKFFFSPQQPQVGQPLRVVAVSEVELGAAALAQTEGDQPGSLSGSSAWGGPPYSWSVTIEAPEAGTQRFLLTSDDPAHPYACGEVKIVQAGKKFPELYVLEEDIAYSLPHSPDRRRLVIYRKQPRPE